MKILSEVEWHPERDAHHRRVEGWIAPRLKRMSLGHKHPVNDFLFEYYSYRPGQLQRWHPGLGYVLQGESAQEYLTGKYYKQTVQGVTADAGLLRSERSKFLHWLREFLQTSQDRPAAFGCFGLHEWAMVYRTDEVRHATWPLRLDPEAIARTVDDLGLRCTHFDAFRFFTPAAAPLNKHPLKRERTIEFDQGGCLHANMDLYKWAFKLAPFTSSDLVADCFELALEVRQLDMEASPYDLRELGYEPVCIEQPEGRQAYEERQRGFAERARGLRARLVAVCDELIETGGASC